MRAALCGNAQVSFKTRKVKGAYNGIDAKKYKYRAKKID